jgi:uncharacterized phage protein (TIGR02218 family)
MAKNIPLQLIEALQKPGTSTCYLVKVKTKEDGIFGFSTADFTLRLDDGLGEVEYSPDEELAPRNIQSTADMTVDNTKLVGWFYDLVEQKVLSGAFDSAEITIFRVSYLRLNLGYEIVGYGTIGEIEYNTDSKDRRKIEFRSLTQQLIPNGNKQYSLTCRTQFGSEECGMPFVWHNGTAEKIPGENPYLIFKVLGVSQPDGYFELGVINYITGQNAGADLEIESWTQDGADGIVKLSYPSPYPVEDGDEVRPRQDCGKTETDCLAYGNIVNMRAEHLAPVEDQTLSVPGAYIRSRGSL